MEPGAKSEAKQGEARAGSGAGASGSGGGGGSIKVYHERQRLQFCLLHALNNLMQVDIPSLSSFYHYLYPLDFMLMFY
jgi:josephin